MLSTKPQREAVKWGRHENPTTAFARNQRVRPSSIILNSCDIATP
jgi:hypothetical protein